MKRKCGNPKGNPNIGEISKTKSTGPRTYRGKLKNAIMSGLMTDGKHSKLAKNRKCETCPLKPYVNEDGEKIFKCAHYTKDGKCILAVNAWRVQLAAYFRAEMYTPAELMQQIASASMKCAEDNYNYESMVEGRPHMWTNEFLNTASDTMEKMGKLENERKKLDANMPDQQNNTVNMFDISGLIKASQIQEQQNHTKEPIKKPEEP